MKPERPTTALFSHRLLAPIVLLLLAGTAPCTLFAAPIVVCSTILEARIIQLTNLERQKYGLPPLSQDATLSVAALGHSREMVGLNYFSHESPTAGLRSVSERTARAGCTDAEVGENIAYYQGYSVEAAASRVVRDWMNSPGHRANILRPSFTAIGIGIAFNHSVTMITQNFSAHHLSFDPIRPSLSGRIVVVRLSGRADRLTSQIGVFDGKRLLQQMSVETGGRFSTVVHLPASSGTHSLQIGLLAQVTGHGASFDICSILPVDTTPRTPF